MEVKIVEEDDIDALLSEGQLNEEQTKEKSKEDIKEPGKKQILEEVRQVSNVIQALENLIIQCDDSETFDHIRYFSEQALTLARRQMREKIHLTNCDL